MPVRRRAQVALARHPGLYRALLEATGRGSADKSACLALVPPGGTVLDIGANEGYFTMLLSDLVGPAGHVHAFEPVPPTFERLSARVRAETCFDNILLHQVAVSDAASEVTIEVPGSDTGQASLVRHRDGSWATAPVLASYRVEAVRLDDVLDVSSPIDFVKCDVEGAELLVLRGMRDILAHSQPMLMLEVCAAWTRGFGYTPTAMFEFLASAGYDRFVEIGRPPRPIADPIVEFGASRADDSVNVLCAASRHAARLQRWC